MYTDVYTCTLYCVCTYLFIQALDRELETHLGSGDPPVPKTTSQKESLQPISELCIELCATSLYSVHGGISKSPKNDGCLIEYVHVFKPQRR